MALGARADSEPILSVSHVGLATPIGGVADSPAESQFAGIAFELDRAFSHVDITVPNMTFHDFSGTAWLTSAIGPAATPANVIASEPFGPINIDIPYIEDYTFLSDLRVSPGIYYFFITSPICVSGCDGYAQWPDAYSSDNSGATATIFTAEGVSYVGNEFIFLPCRDLGNPTPDTCAALNSTFAPALPWGFAEGPPQYAIDITAREVAEPATVVLVLTGILLIGASRPKCRKLQRA